MNVFHPAIITVLIVVLVFQYVVALELLKGGSVKKKIIFTVIMIPFIGYIFLILWLICDTIKAFFINLDTYKKQWRKLK